MDQYDFFKSTFSRQGTSTNEPFSQSIRRDNYTSSSQSSPLSPTHPSPMLPGYNRPDSYSHVGLDKILQPSYDHDYGAGIMDGEGPYDPIHDSRNLSDYSESVGDRRASGSGRKSKAGARMDDVGDPVTTAKRGSKACVACRKGKNRCEPDPTGRTTACKRCIQSKVPCVFQKPSERSRPRNDSMSVDLSGDAEGRVSNLERSVRDLASGQDQIQMALQQILANLPNTTPAMPHDPASFLSQAQTRPSDVTPFFQTPMSPPLFGNPPSAHDQTSILAPSRFSVQNGTSSPQNIATGRASEEIRSKEKKPKKEFPKLPGFAPPDHRFGTYGIIPISSAPPSPSHSRRSSRLASPTSVDDSALPEDSLTAPIQALQALANAADQAAAKRETDSADPEIGDHHDEAGGDLGPRRKRVRTDRKDLVLRVIKQTQPDPTPRNPFPDVVTKGLVTESEARELWDIFFSGCHYFVPLWDKKYDTYETYIERTPFSTNGLLAVAAKIRAGNGPVGQTFHRCLEEAQGIARSTLFGPIVRKEAVMAMLILSVWSQNGWLPCGHALRGGLDMNLHRALDKLAAETSEPRGEDEERDLVVSARIWLNCYMHHHLVSLGTGKPLLLNDESFVRHARLLLSHPMASETDMRLIAGVELVNLRVRAIEHLRPLHGKVDFQTISFVKRMFADLQAWYNEWYAIHRQRYEEEHVLVKLLEAELVYAQMWTVCIALRGCQWDKLPSDQRELALQAKDAAMRCMEIFLRSANFRDHLKYATHDQLVSVAFSAVFVLKIAILYPSSVSLPDLTSQVSELAHLLSAECFAERYALTLRLMLANFRRKTGAISTVPGTPRLLATSHDMGMSSLNGTHTPQGTMAGNGMDLDGGLQSLLSLPQMGGEYDASGMGNLMVDGLEGFAWPNEFSPSNLPVWLQEGNVTDLGLPQDGSDSLFLPPELASMFLPSGTNNNAGYQFTLPDSGDVGAEAW